MDIFGLGIGLPQLLVVLIVAMLVLGPERLPEVARQLARGVRMLRGYATDVQSQFGGELDEIKEELLGIQRDLSDVQGSLRGGLLDIDQSLRSVQGEFQNAVGSVSGAIETASTAAPPAPPEFKPETPAALRSAMYSPALPAAPAAPMPGDSRLPDYRPPGSR
jgi:sec-independent protein translocase protein TatB